MQGTRNFEGSAWVVYDRCYRRRAAVMKNLVWSTPDSALYNEAFTGRARAIPRCEYCLSENHTVADCPDCPRDLLGCGHSSHGSPGQPHVSHEICRLFNQVRCRSRRCKYQHLCSTCSLSHPAMVYPSHGRGNRPRMFQPSAGNQDPSVTPFA